MPVQNLLQVTVKPIGQVQHIAEVQVQELLHVLTDHRRQVTEATEAAHLQAAALTVEEAV